MIKFTKNLYRKYMEGAKANYFPFSKYGFFGERYKGPEVTAEELHKIVDETSEEDLKKFLKDVFD